MSDYVIWKHDFVDNATKLTKSTGLDDVFKLHEGQSIKDLGTESISFSMDPETPANMLLTDSLNNQYYLYVVSEKIKSILSDLALDYLEIEPITVINHKQRNIEEQYFLIQATGVVDCIDQDKSDIEFCPIEVTDIEEIDLLVLDETKIPADKPLFLLKHFGYNMVVRRDVADAISASGATGILWKEINEFKY